MNFHGKKVSLAKMTADSTPNQSAASVSTVCNDVDNPSQEDLCQLFSALAVSSSKPAILALVEPHCESYVPSSLSGGLPIILSTLYNSEFLSLNYSELLLKASECVISVTPEQADLGENLTRGQNKSRLWSRMRSGRITASRLKDACCTDPAKPTETLISSICHPELSKFKTAATTWGNDRESVARNKYRTVVLWNQTECWICMTLLISINCYSNSDSKFYLCLNLYSFKLSALTHIKMQALLLLSKTTVFALRSRVLVTCAWKETMRTFIRYVFNPSLNLNCCF